jgi:hypothetical protein
MDNVTWCNTLPSECEEGGEGRGNIKVNAITGSQNVENVHSTQYTYSLQSWTNINHNVYWPRQMLWLLKASNGAVS